ncbi:hypothetical protein OsJ_11909 [Oryza sativa Japonica Group]|nr:hypothetical protein LOC_Os03g44600 [Oryza sativa Japonica Group]ABF97897.1 hypothetical protein LOC_Os03g44600 [Oryza sativa Japonica Group]EAZ27949.1 hypothetical protein OsJ_11909 [Oryza sativa Japonica Group]
MEGGSSSSSTNRRKGNGRLPLIKCPCCDCETIIRRAANTPENKGRIFYTCPCHQRDGIGCRFWYWEEQYEEYLINTGHLASRAVHIQSPCSAVRVQTNAMVQQGAQPYIENDAEQIAKQIKLLVRRMNLLIDIGRDIVALLRCVVAACVVVAVTNMYAFFRSG